MCHYTAFKGKAANPSGQDVLAATLSALRAASACLRALAAGRTLWEVRWSWGNLPRPSFGQEQSLGCSSGKAGAEMNYNADLFCGDKALPGTDSLQRAQIEPGVK